MPSIYGFALFESYALAAVYRVYPRLCYHERKTKDRKKTPMPFTEVVLIIECDEAKAELVEETYKIYVMIIHKRNLTVLITPEESRIPQAIIELPPLKILMNF